MVAEPYFGVWIAEAGLTNARLQWQNRLSFKQARAAVIITLLIGVGFSALQIFWDLHGERNQIDRTVNQVLSTVRESATQAAYGLDETLAERVVSGLFEYEPIYIARLRDDFGNVLAKQQRQQTSSNLNWLTSLMFGDNQHYEIPLTIGDSADLVGYLEIDVDTGLIGAGFINRSVMILASGLVRNFLLGIALTVFFYIALTKPLLRLVHSLRQVDPASPATTKVDIPANHMTDELGLLAQSTNGLLMEIDDNLWRLREAEQSLRERESRLRGIMQNVADGILSVDSDCLILQCNPACLQLLHLPENTELIGRSLYDFIVDASQLNLSQALEQTERKDASFRPVLDQSIELVLRCADGGKIRVAAVFRPMQFEDNLLYTVVFHDVTAQRRYEERLVYMANHDPLTDLPNRSMLELSLHKALGDYREPNALPSDETAPPLTATALLFIDLDRFKLVNDSLGHDFGDLLLKEVAHRLRSVIRRSDTLGRLGGDEFLIIIPHLTETQEAATLGQTVLDAFSPAFEIRGRQLFVSPSIGIALSPADGDDFATLMRNADAAMYSAKARGGGTYHFFTKMMNESAVARLAMENDLRDAIKALPGRKIIYTNGAESHADRVLEARGLTGIRGTGHRHVRTASGRAGGHLALARGSGIRRPLRGDGGRARDADPAGSRLGGRAALTPAEPGCRWTPRSSISRSRSRWSWRRPVSALCCCGVCSDPRGR